jgi:type IV pilus assembly protein PilF
MRIRSTQLGLLTLVIAGLAGGGVGCATTSRADRQHELRKAASHLEVGVDHLANKRGALALREFMAAEQLDPKNARVHYALSEAYLAQGKPGEAERHLERALELFAGHHDARQSLAALLLIDGRYEEAIAHCERLVDDPTYSTPWAALTNRAWAEYRLGRTEAARESLGMAREYRNDYWPATLAMAMIENDGGRRMEAIRLYHDIISLKPGPEVESEVNFRLAEIYVALGQRRQALSHLSTSVARLPSGPWAKKSQEYLKLLH